MKRTDGRIGPVGTEFTNNARASFAGAATQGLSVALATHLEEFYIFTWYNNQKDIRWLSTK